MQPTSNPASNASIVLSISTIDHLRDLQRGLFRPNAGKTVVKLALPDLTREQNAKLGDKLTRRMSDCGCQLGAISALGSVIALICGARADLTPILSIDTLRVVGLVIGSAVVGKVVGVALARVVAYRLVDRILETSFSGSGRDKEH